MTTREQRDWAKILPAVKSARERDINSIAQRRVTQRVLRLLDPGRTRRQIPPPLVPPAEQPAYLRPRGLVMEPNSPRVSFPPNPRLGRAGRKRNTKKGGRKQRRFSHRK